MSLKTGGQRGGGATTIRSAQGDAEKSDPKSCLYITFTDPSGVGDIFQVCQPLSTPSLPYLVEIYSVVVRLVAYSYSSRAKVITVGYFTNRIKISQWRIINLRWQLPYKTDQLQLGRVSVMQAVPNHISATGGTHLALSWSSP